MFLISDPYVSLMSQFLLTPYINQITFDICPNEKKEKKKNSIYHQTPKINQSISPKKSHQSCNLLPFTAFEQNL